MDPKLHIARASAHAFPSLATAWVTGTDQLSCVERTAKACCPSPLPPSPSKVQYAGHCRATQSRRSSTKRCRASSRRHLTSASKIYVGSLYPATVFSRSFISTPSSSSLLRQVRGRLASLATSLAPVERVHEPRHTSPRSTNAGTSDLRRTSSRRFFEPRRALRVPAISARLVSLHTLE